MTRRIVQPGIDLSGEVIDLPPPAVRHVARVLRLSKGDELLILDGRGGEARVVLERVAPGVVTVKVVTRSMATRPAVPSLRLIQAIPKGAKLDEIVRRVTELGVASIAPVTSERSVPRPTPAQMARRLERWRRIAAEASRQCGRSIVPTIDDVVPLDEAMATPAAPSRHVMLWEEERATSLADVLCAGQLERGVTLVVGPEGGFSTAEVDRAADLGLEVASLGPLVLRVDTAAVAACVLAQHYVGGLSPDEGPWTPGPTGTERAGS